MQNTIKCNMLCKINKRVAVVLHVKFNFNSIPYVSFWMQYHKQNTGCVAIVMHCTNGIYMYWYVKETYNTD